MNTYPPRLKLDSCQTICASDSSAEALNSDCFCLSVDKLALQAELQTILADCNVPGTFAETHPHLFSALPVHVSPRHIEQMASVAEALEEIVALPAYQVAALAWAPQVATFNPGSPGGLLGLDFHLGLDGPRLIEVNTNPGGALLNAVLGRAQRVCMPELTVPPTNVAQAENAVLQSILMEWRLQRDFAPMEFVAIVDELPTQQYLYPEFVLYRELFRQHGYRAEICAPQELIRRGGRLWLGGTAVDLVYNRLTDFALQQDEHQVLRTAYLAKEVAMSPHPRAHALYADKRNLSLLGDREFLESSGSSLAALNVLLAAVPSTQFVTPVNRDAMWANRRHLFFKPVAGFGSKATYRGDKLTRRVWGEIEKEAYVAQEIVSPSERQVAKDAVPLKVDIRCYAYRGQPLLFAARMYQGQTTNFRTPGGGFAPVLTTLMAPPGGTGDCRYWAE
jgi:hypothetical protein